MFHLSRRHKKRRNKGEYSNKKSNALRNALLQFPVKKLNTYPKFYNSAKINTKEKLDRSLANFKSLFFSKPK